MRAELIHRTCDFIASTQLASGAIPWFRGGIADPWDHVEAAMGLSIGGRFDEAQAAYRWLARRQHADGYWLAAYDGERVADGTRAETNFVAYIATGVWHHFLATGNQDFLRELWPTVKRAMDFVMSLQAPTGEIYWALDTRTGINRDALVTGCSSIYKSLECAIAIAGTLGEPCTRWMTGRRALGFTLSRRPDRFDRTWESKARYSMDWFYPVLSGAIGGDRARARIDARWSEFVEPGIGCRCVADQPWVTVAETCELVLACLKIGQDAQAARLFEQLARFQVEDGSWWTGYVFADGVNWPDERPTWTAAAILLAADALYALTPASGLFTMQQQPRSEALEHTQRVRRR